MKGYMNTYKNIKAAMFLLLVLGWIAAAFPAQAQTSTQWGFSNTWGNLGNYVKTGNDTITIIKNKGEGSSAFKQEPSDSGPSSPYNDTTKNNEKGGFWNNLGQWANDAGNAIKNGLENVGDYIQTGWNALSDAAKSVTDWAVEEAKKLVGYSNYLCRQDRMDKIYLNGCYSCKVVKELLSAFLNGCAYLENVSKEAGKKILILGFVLWIAFYVLQQISSWKNIEPSAMVNDMLTMAFKVLGAWFVIAAGYQICVDFVLVPFLQWGLDFGNTLLSKIAAASGVNLEGPTVETVSGPTGFLPATFLNKLIKYVSGVDSVTSQHMKLGHMIACHSCHAGKWLIIPNAWIMICGVLIWFFGFMMTLSILFYLVDMSFKLSIALVALPIVVGLWPFGITRDRFSACIKIILNAAGIFVFLAMTASIALIVVAKCIDVGTSVDGIGGGIQSLFTAVDEGNAEFVSDVLSLWGSCFILLVFAYLFGIRTIGSTMQDYVSPFFPENALTKVNPMHHKMTQQLDMVNKKVKGVVGLGVDIVKTQTALGFSKGVQRLAGRKDGEKDKSLTDKASDLSKKMEKLSKGEQFKEEGPKKEESKLDTAKKVTNLEAKDDKKIEEKTSGTKPETSEGGGGTSASAQAMDAAGEGLTAAGEATKQAAEAASEGVRAAGQGVAAAGDAAAVPTLGISAAVGHGVQAGAEASATAIKVSGQVAGETMKQTGKAMKKAAKVADKVEKGVKKAAKIAKKAAKKAGKTAEKAKERIDKEMQKGNAQNNQQNQQQPQDNGSDDAVENITSTMTGSKK